MIWPCPSLYASAGDRLRRVLRILERNQSGSRGDVGAQDSAWNLVR